MGRKKANRKQAQARPARASEAAEAKARPPAGARRMVIRFLLVFAGVMALFYLIWVLPIVRKELFPEYLHWTAAVGAVLVRLFGHAVEVNGQMIISPDFSLQVGRGCDAVQPTMLFLAALIALPAPRRAKLWGALVGTALLLGLNVVRICTLFYIGLHKPDLFHLMHVDVWQSVFIFVALLLWFLWALWALRPAAPGVAAGEDAGKPA